MAHVAAVTFQQARDLVLDRVRSAPRFRRQETVPLHESPGRVLAAPLIADRDYPAEPRAMRDGFAVRSADCPGTLEIIGEVRAGQRCPYKVSRGQAVEIMTGATAPEGADAVIMIEHARRDGRSVTVPATAAGDHINPRGASARAGSTLLEAGTRITPAVIALLASTGVARPPVFARPSAAIIATGDELVEVEQQPEPWQIRNSNAHALAAQVARAGGAPSIFPVAADDLEATSALVEAGLRHDLLLLSGGVSAGRYDVVEEALRRFDAEFFFDRVLIQPGQPCVFGRARGTFFFGLPGNPASTFVCFEIFARAALDLLSGVTAPALPITRAPLAQPFRHKPGLTRFLPARLEPGGALTPLPWAGSGDTAALARAGCFLVAAPDRPVYELGELIQVLIP